MMQKAFKWDKAEKRERYGRFRREIICQHAFGKHADPITGVIRCKVCNQIVGRV